MFDRREFLTGGASVVAAGCVSTPVATVGAAVGDKSFSLNHRGQLALPFPGVKTPVKVWVTGDTHMSYVDSRDDQYREHYRRMSGRGMTRELFEKFLADAKAAKVDLVLLAGDIISFPTLANVEAVQSCLDQGGVDWMYTPGNHDWHFEGDDGSDLEQRDRWVKRRLQGFFPEGVNPTAYSRVVKGVRFVAIDDSTYRIREEQLNFWRAEIAKGDPTVLFMHIPLYVPGNTIHTLGHPDWGAAQDPYWQIERRQRWDERPSATTLAFRREVLSAPNLVAAFSGHLHQFQAAHFCGQNLFTVQIDPDAEWKVFHDHHLDITIGEQAL